MSRQRLQSILALVALVMTVPCWQGCRRHTKLTIDFGGVIALVPAAKDDFKKDHTQYVTALAVADDDVAHGHTGKKLSDDLKHFTKAEPEQDATVPAHSTFLRVPTRNLCMGKEGPCEASPQMNDAISFFHLDGVDLQIGDLSAGRGVDLKGTAAIPNLEAISPGLGIVRTGCLNNLPDGCESRVAARLRFAHGTLTPGGLGASADLWYHKNGQGTSANETVTLFEHALLCTEVEGEVVHVDILPLADQKCTGDTGRLCKGTEQHFRLRAVPGDRKPIKIALFDAPFADILCWPDACGNEYNTDGHTVSHFDLLYTLSQNEEADGYIFYYPWVRSFHPHLGNPYCSLAGMNP
jgi:hypothetical protein